MASQIELLRSCGAGRAFQSFQRRMQEWATPPGDPTTNLIDVGRRSYRLPPRAYAQLLQHLEACRCEGIPMHFAERQATEGYPSSGLMLDFDAVYATETPPSAAGTPQLARELQEVSTRVAQGIAAVLDFPPGRQALAVFSIVRPEAAPAEAAGKPGLKRGFHLLLPGLALARPCKRLVVQRLRESQLLQAALRRMGIVGAPGGGGLEAVLDANSASVPVMLLGSCKPGSARPYVLGPAYRLSFYPEDLAQGGGFAAEPLPLEECNAVYELSVAPDGLRPAAGLVYPDLKEAGEGLPLVAPRELGPRPELLGALEADQAVPPPEAEAAGRSLSTLALHDPEAKQLKKLLALLPPRYYDEYPLWRNVVYALAHTSSLYLPLAAWFSQRSAKWDRAALERLWEEALIGRPGRPLTKRSILHWAREEAPGRFQAVAAEGYFAVLSDYVFRYSGHLEHYMVAKVLQAMLGDKMVTDVDQGEHRWYEFVVPGQAAEACEVWKWREEAQPDTLQAYISEQLARVAEELAAYLDQRRAAAENEEKAKYYAGLGKTFSASVRRLFNDGFKRGAVKQAAVLFRRRGFVQLLDRDPLLLGVGNGVLRLAHPRAGLAQSVLVDHFHEWPVSCYTRTRYRAFDPEERWTRLLLGALRDIIPEPDARRWILYFLATGLYRGLKEPIMLLWVGGGCNGKTFVMELVSTVLGEHYAGKLRITLLTSAREGADKPNSALMRLKGRGYGYFEESARQEVLNPTRLKEVVNPGKIAGRDLNSREESFPCTATLIAASNHSFVVNDTDHGCWRRLRHYAAKVTFTDGEPDPGNRFEKKKDGRYMKEYMGDPGCQAAFLSILVHFWDQLQRVHGGLVDRVPCPTIERETQEYRNSQDLLNRFICARMVVSPGAPPLSLQALAGAYQQWLQLEVNLPQGRSTVSVSGLARSFENSSLKDRLRRTEAGELMLVGCRVQTDPGLMVLREGEHHVGARAGPAARPAAPAAAEPERWWEEGEVPPRPRARSAPRRAPRCRPPPLFSDARLARAGAPAEPGAYGLDDLYA